MEECEKEYIDEKIEFLLRPKTKKDIERIMDIIRIYVTRQSHNIFCGAPAFKGYSGHAVRKDYRRELFNYARLQLRTKFDVKPHEKI